MLEVHRLLNKFNAKRVAEQQQEEAIGVVTKKCRFKTCLSSCHFVFHCSVTFPKLDRIRLYFCSTGLGVTFSVCKKKRPRFAGYQNLRKHSTGHYEFY